jgi:CRISPR/Cas system CSM-associated protein Csm2 small subunit
MIKSKLNYAVARVIKTNRSEEGVYKNLADFITRGIDLVKEPKDYHVFVALFEAVYGFYYAKNPKKD